MLIRRFFAAAFDAGAITLMPLRYAAFAYARCRYVDAAI